jgi:hypothetical protein
MRTGFRFELRACLNLPAPAEARPPAPAWVTGLAVADPALGPARKI